MFEKKVKWAIGIEIFALIVLCVGIIFGKISASKIQRVDGDFIKWVDFNIPCEALERAYWWDVETHEKEVELDWIELLAYLAVKYGGNYKLYKESDLNELAEGLVKKEYTMEEITKDKK